VVVEPHTGFFFDCKGLPESNSVKIVKRAVLSILVWFSLVRKTKIAIKPMHIRAPLANKTASLIEKETMNNRISNDE
jgi:hypothetical protein